jgi:hypothetical protein
MRARKVEARNSGQEKGKLLAAIKDNRNNIHIRYGHRILLYKSVLKQWTSLFANGHTHLLHSSSVTNFRAGNVTETRYRRNPNSSLFFSGGRNGALWSIDVTAQSWHVGSWQKKKTQKFPTLSNAAAVPGSPQRTSIVSLCVSANLYVAQVPTVWLGRSYKPAAHCTALPPVVNFTILPLVSTLIWSRLKLRVCLVRFRINCLRIARWSGFRIKEFARSYCNLTITGRLRSLISPTLWGKWSKLTPRLFH